MHFLHRGWEEFWQPPEPAVQQSGTAGELAVARVRVVLVAVLLTVSVQGNFLRPTVESMILMETAGAYLLLAYVTYAALKRITYRPWMGFATSGLDVTMVSVGLLLLLMVGHPHAAVNSQVLFPVYMVILASTALRMDHRVGAVAGLAAIVQYVGILSIARAGWDLNDPQFAPFLYGTFNLGNQVARIVLLAAATLIATIVSKGVQLPHVLSTTDPLTGLTNRRAFMEALEGELARASRYGRPISTLMIDIDHFKQFNDVYGHQGGDRALQLVALAIRSRLRSGDLITRYGGEEFVVVLPETGVERAMATAEQLRLAVAATPLPLSTREEAQVTVSIGVASWPESGQVLSKLLQQADARLYAAKNAGRDQVNGPVRGIERPFPQVRSTVNR